MSSNNIGEWEKYTKGIGSKLLAKMGFQPGQGLGKNAQGIAAPIEVNVRPGKGALGAYEFEDKPSKKAPKERQKQEQQKKKNNEQTTTYKRQDYKDNEDNNRDNREEKPKKLKIYEKSIDELIREGIQSGTKSGFGENKRMKIIDMTGPDKRVLTGISQLHQSKAMKPKDDYTPTEYNTRYDVPELKANLDRLLKITENKLTKCIQDNERDIKNVDVYVDEIKRLRNVVNNEESKLKMLEVFDDFVKELEDLDDDTSIEKILDKFESFRGNRKDLEDFGRLLRFDDLLTIVLEKRLQKELRFWKPFTKEDRVLRIFKRLKKLVVSDKSYELLLWNCWNTSVFRALQGWHSMKNFKEPILFFERWVPLLPRWLFSYQIKEVVMAKVVRELEQWNPMEDPIPVTAWLFPWNSVILENNREENLFELFSPAHEIIRQKLSEALLYWQPDVRDRSVFSMIKPWKGKFQDKEMNTFLSARIAPRLEIVLRSIQIDNLTLIGDMKDIEDKQEENGERAWNWVAEWKFVFDRKAFVRMLERSLFPNLLICFHGHLSGEAVDYLAIEKLYWFWKKRLDHFVDQEDVQRTLFMLLTMIHHRVDEKIGLKAYDFYQSHLSDKKTEDKNRKDKEKDKNNKVRYSHVDAMNFKQLVERMATEKGILFMPINGRMQEGRQVYQFGSSIVYIDNQVLFCQKSVRGQRSWAPVGLQDLVDQSATY